MQTFRNVVQQYPRGRQHWSVHLFLLLLLRPHFTSYFGMYTDIQNVEFNSSPIELLFGLTTIDVQLLTNRRSLILWLFKLEMFPVAQQ